MTERRGESLELWEFWEWFRCVPFRIRAHDIWSGARWRCELSKGAVVACRHARGIACKVIVFFFGDFIGYGDGILYVGSGLRGVELAEGGTGRG